MYCLALTLFIGVADDLAFFGEDGNGNHSRDYQHSRVILCTWARKWYTSTITPCPPNGRRNNHQTVTPVKCWTSNVCRTSDNKHYNMICINKQTGIFWYKWEQASGSTYYFCEPTAADLFVRFPCCVDDTEWPVNRGYLRVSFDFTDQFSTISNPRHLPNHWYVVTLWGHLLADFFLVILLNVTTRS